MTTMNRFIFINDEITSYLPQKHTLGTDFNCDVKDKCERGNCFGMCEYRSV